MNCTLNSDNVWIIDCEIDVEESCGYKDSQGEIVIEYGKYQMIYTDTFRTYAIVLKEGEGFIGIDRNEKTLYKVFPYDNGPDYESEGLFRIENEGKIGYANYETGEIVIEAKYSAALPFQNTYAVICKDCIESKEIDHWRWKGGKWGLINKEGLEIIEPKYERIKSIDKNGIMTVLKNGEEKQIKIK